MNVIITSTTLTGKQHKRIIKDVKEITTIRDSCLKLKDNNEEDYVVFVNTYTKLEIIDNIFGRYLQ